MRFNVHSIECQIARLFAQGQQAFDDLVNAYFWVQRHAKEMNRACPNFSREKFRQDFLRVFHVDIRRYCRVARKLGGSDTLEGVDSGRDLIRRLGVFETFRAEAALTDPQLGRLRSMITDDTDEEQFRAMVDKIMPQPKEIEASEPNAAVVDLAEAKRLQKENLRLRRENEQLRKERDLYREKLAAIKAATAGVGADV